MGVCSLLLVLAGGAVALHALLTIIGLHGDGNLLSIFLAIIVGVIALVVGLGLNFGKKWARVLGQWNFAVGVLAYTVLCIVCAFELRESRPGSFRYGELQEMIARAAVYSIVSLTWLLYFSSRHVRNYCSK
jgi:hypothetical protein